MGSKKVRQSSDPRLDVMNPRQKLEAAMDGAASNLSSLLKGRDPDFLTLSISFREDGSFLATARKLGPDGGKLVAFGRGETWMGAIVDLSGGIAAGRWKDDKFR